MIIETNSAKETFQLGKQIGEKALPGQIYTLNGDLGVGKTVFTQGVACGLGNVMKTRDGEPLSGGASAASDFAAFNSQPTVTQPAAYYNNMPQQTAQPMYSMPQQYNQSQYTQQGFRVNPITGEVIG